MTTAERLRGVDDMEARKKTNYEDYQETMRAEAHRAQDDYHDARRRAREDAHDATFMDRDRAEVCDDDDEEGFQDA